MANTEKSPPAAEPAPEPKRSSPLALILPLVIVTVIAVGAGGAFGMLFLPRPQEAPTESRAPAHRDRGELPLAGGASLKTLSPIITNLAGPKSTWVRLDSALVLDGEPPADADLLGARIADDILAYLRTLSLQHIEGASGLQNLREDLNDIVRIRSGGKVHELMIETLIVE